MVAAPVRPSPFLLGFALALFACSSGGRKAHSSSDGGTTSRGDSLRTPSDGPASDGADGPPAAEEETPAEEEEPDRGEVKREECEVKGRVLTLVTAFDSICDGIECHHSEDLTVEDRDGTVLLAASNEHMSFRSSRENTGEEDDVSLACQEGELLIRGAGYQSLALGYDRKRRRLHLPAKVIALARDREKVNEDELPGERAGTGNLLEALLAGQERKDEGPRPTAIGGLDRTFVRSFWLAAARERIVAGAWASGETLLESVVDEPEKPLPAPIKKRRAQLLALLRSARASTVPVRVLERRRLGSTLAAQKLPTEAGERATMFWVGRELCVVQEEQPPRAMRCHAPDRKAWNPAVAIAVPDSGGHHLKAVHHDSSEACEEGTFVMQDHLKESDENPCQSGPGEPIERLLAVVDRNVMLLTDGPEYQPYLDRDGTNAPLAMTEVTATMARSAGGLVAGEGCCRFFPDGMLTRLGTDGEQRWDVRGEPPKGERWVGSPLVSPDQRWAVLQSQLDSGRVTLWLLRLSPPN
jgi:hypothetical protein